MIVEFFCVVGGLGIGYLLSTSPESIKAKIRAEEAKTRANRDRSEYGPLYALLTRDPSEFVVEKDRSIVHKPSGSKLRYDAEKDHAGNKVFAVSYVIPGMTSQYTWDSEVISSYKEFLSKLVRDSYVEFYLEGSDLEEKSEDIKSNEEG